MNWESTPEITSLEQQTEARGTVSRMIHHPVPFTVDYCPTDWGHALCSPFDPLLGWAAPRDPLAIFLAGRLSSRGVG